MVRGKTQMKKIENAVSRQVKFTKRKNGLLKKAYELSVFCGADVGLMIFSPAGKLHELASPSMQILLDKYQKCSLKDVLNNTNRMEDIEDHRVGGVGWRYNESGLHFVRECLKKDLANMKEKIQNFETTQRKMLGEGLASCSMIELNQLESQVKRGLRHIRDQKNKILVDKIGQLKSKERFLCEENDFLRKRIGNFLNI